MLCQLSYSHRIFVIITTRVGGCQTQADEKGTETAGTRERVTKLSSAEA